jgi:hypothetical protein
MSQRAPAYPQNNHRRRNEASRERIQTTSKVLLIRLELPDGLPVITERWSHGFA